MEKSLIKNIIFGKERRGNLLLSLLFFLTFLVSFFGFSEEEKYVSLAPNLTEMAIAVGGVNQLVGVTDYCSLKDSIRAVGGYLDVRWEALVSLRPKGVFLLSEQHRYERRLKELGIKSYLFDCSNVGEIRESMNKMALLLGDLSHFKQWDKKIGRQIQELERKYEKKAKKRCLIIVSYQGQEYPKNIYVASPQSFMGELMALAGGSNCIQNSKVIFPMISMEALLNFNPEIIFILGPGRSPLIEKKKKAPWPKLKNIPALEKNEVYYFHGDAFLRPGPSIIELLDAFCQVLYSE